MKVLVATNMWPTQRDPWGGCFVEEQVADVRATGAQVDVMFIDGRASATNYARGFTEVRRRVRGASFDLVHAHYGLTGAVALAQWRVPVITTFHGSDIYVRWQRFISWIVARRSAPVFVSEKLARMLSLPTAAIIPAGVDTERFHQIPKKEARAALGWPEENPYVLLPGARNSPSKGAQLFEQAVSEARRTEPQLRTTYLENLSREGVFLVLNAVDVTLVTSTHEGSPVAVRESLACATPVVSVPVGDLPQLLRDLPGCSIRSRDPTALANGVLDALSIGKRQELRQRAEETSRPRIAERIRVLYEQVLSQNRPARPPAS
jgi:teichuronic acid biosynthesis glycosyltransferase TuaC